MDVTGFYVHTVTVETFLGSGSTGDRYATARAVPGYVDDGVVLTGDRDAERIEGRTQFYCDTAYAAWFTVQSRVTWNGRPMQVETVRVLDGGPEVADLGHVLVGLR